MHLILKELPIKVWGDGSVVRDYVHATDFAKACLAAVQVDKVGTLNIGSGEGISIKNLIASVEQAAGKKAIIEWLPGRNFDVPRVVLDCSLAKQQLDWQPSVKMQLGLLQTQQWMSQLIDEGKL